MALVEIKNLTKSFGQVKAVDNLSLDLEGNQQYAIQGASGSGKSTLLYMLGGLDTPSAGKISVGGNDLSQLTDEALAQYRNRYVGFVFQFHFLLPSLNCLNNILLPSKIGNQDPSGAKEVAIELADHLGVSHCLKKYPFELSGGEQQRINIIRALSLKPKLLLCDEPTGNLDSENSQKVTRLLKELATEHNSTLVVVTHDLNVAQQFGHRIQMKDGHIVS